jgi:ribosomal protein S18 acetylase RimI-like enzyme
MFQVLPSSNLSLGLPTLGLKKPLSKMGTLPAAGSTQNHDSFSLARPAAHSLPSHTIFATSKLEAQDLLDYVKLASEAFPPQDIFGNDLKRPTKEQKKANSVRLIALHNIIATDSDQATLVGVKGTNGKLEGGVALTPFYSPISECKPIAQIHTLVITPEQRRLGLGTALVKEAEKKAKQFGYDTALITIDKAKPALQSFYKKLGYKKMPFFKALWAYEPWRSPSRFLTLQRLWKHPFYEKVL